METHFWWLLLGVALGAVGMVALGAYAVRATRKIGITPRRRARFIAMRRDLDVALAASRALVESGADAITARLEVLRGIPIEVVAGSPKGAKRFARQIAAVWSVVPESFKDLRDALVAAEFNAETIRLSFALEEEPERGDGQAKGGKRREA